MAAVAARVSASASSSASSEAQAAAQAQAETEAEHEIEATVAPATSIRSYVGCWASKFTRVTVNPDSTGIFEFAVPCCQHADFPVTAVVNSDGTTGTVSGSSGAMSSVRTSPRLRLGCFGALTNCLTRDSVGALPGVGWIHGASGNKRVALDGTDKAGRSGIVGPRPSAASDRFRPQPGYIASLKVDLGVRRTAGKESPEGNSLRAVRGGRTPIPALSAREHPRCR